MSRIKTLAAVVDDLFADDATGEAAEVVVNLASDARLTPQEQVAVARIMRHYAAIVIVRDGRGDVLVDADGMFVKPAEVLP